MDTMESTDVMAKLTSLCKRRGFVFQSSEIYGGLKSCYDYGPLGVELKRNIAQAWWKTMTFERDDIVGLDASILMHPKVWQTSGHVGGFSDPLVDCKNCKERFRADKAPRKDPGTAIEYLKNGKKSDGIVKNTVGPQGYVCPVCGGSELSHERQFNLMFKTNIGPVDQLNEAAQALAGKSLTADEIRKILDEYGSKTATYLRPETAQAMFVQFLNIQTATALKIPFGVAQIGKSFRNEIVVEHYIFRSCEFEQMEMEYFIEPGTQKTWLDYWKNERIDWYRQFAHGKDHFRLRQHDRDELAHYSDDCFDIEYLYPWGWGEIEGVASRTDYDLTKHSEGSGVKLTYFDPQKVDPVTGKAGMRYTPYVIEPAAGLTRLLLVFLLDAYTEEKGVDHEGKEKIRVVLKLHPQFAPIKAAVLPLVKKDGQPEYAEKIVKTLRKNGFKTSYDEQQSIGKRYAKHDEIGTPFCLTVDNQTLADHTVTVRNRDTTEQTRIGTDQIVTFMNDHIPK